MPSVVSTSPPITTTRTRTTAGPTVQVSRLRRRRRLSLSSLTVPLLVPLTVKINKPKVNKLGNNNNNAAAGPGKKLQRRPNSGKGAVQAKGPNNKKKAAPGPKREKEAPVSSTDLDKQMAACKSFSQMSNFAANGQCTDLDS